MTARQPPGEKGAKACTIGCDSSRDEYFCAYFSGELTKKESKSMKNGARYVVTTHWGTFSLDEASYQDYLAGNLWICWTPGKPAQPQQTKSSYIPPNVTERAVSIRDQADKSGILDTLHKLGVHDALVPYSSRLADLSIDEMNLTVRSSNGLKRASIHTFGSLKEVLAIENGLLNIRNIGQKSIKEIKQLFFEECYNRLLPYEKAHYWQEVLDSQQKM
jgi:hypothetical protein